MQQLSEQQKFDAAIKLVAIFAHAIRALGKVTEGELYAHTMQYVNLETFQSIMRILVSQKYIKIENHVVTWKGARDVDERA